MTDKSIFVFGSKIFEEQPKRDAITALPLEIAWKIFSYLDDQSLQIAYHTSKTWARIITVNKNLRKRLNFFELAIRLGSRNLARFHRRNMKRLKKERKNYLECGEKTNPKLSQEVALGSKRAGEYMNLNVKRHRLF